ncbi:Kae1-like domain-containing protein [Leptothrix discophora]|uniref:Carbamoyltransferase HypF n=1 Tax=Leptothrix discophora TaxID=89 RepID=A0ABT9G1B8_LEPDI|nr:carbamoyltransferase HypF [Leptothrix discophora]MDP4300290.1 carbamoyltransferase HypF [Leptothrix discophora]
MPRVLATGAYLKNAAGLWLDGAWLPSPDHGDLVTPQACRALEDSLERLLARAGHHLDGLAHDLHPDFHSTRLAQALAERLGLPALSVQHHLAHVGVVLAEQALAGTPVEGPVIGIVLDGYGRGADGGAWGGELLWVDGPHWLRVGHLAHLALPGGDRAAREPWRMASAALHALGRADEITRRHAGAVGIERAHGLRAMLERGLNCPPTSSAGRWFDAAAAALGLCWQQQHEAEAAQALEALATQHDDDGRLTGFEPDPRLAPATLRDGRIDLGPVVAELFDAWSDATQAPQRARLAHHFHLAMADGLAQAAARAAAQDGCDTVVLAGGCLFNRLLSQALHARLSLLGLRVLRPVAHSCGDAALALGQAWIARQRLAAGMTQGHAATPSLPVRSARPSPRFPEPQPCA